MAPDIKVHFYRQSELLRKILPFSPATLWRKVKAGEFPAPVKLGPRITAWRVSDVNAWLEKMDSR